MFLLGVKSDLGDDSNDRDGSGAGVDCGDGNGSLPTVVMLCVADTSSPTLNSTDLHCNMTH
jgi:hypothetical protein